MKSQGSTPAALLSKEKLLFSRHEAATALSLSVRSIDALINSGTLPAVRVGSRVLVHRDAVHRFATAGHATSVRVPKYRTL